MIIFFWMNAFFSYLNLKKKLFGGGGRGSKWRSACQVKKAQNRSSMALHAVSHSMPQRRQSGIKKQGGMLVIKILNTCPR